MVWLYYLLGAIAALAVVSFGIYIALSLWAESYYDRILENPANACDIDAFVNSPPNKLKVSLFHFLQIGNREFNSSGIPLEVYDSPHVEGLKVTRKLGTGTPVESLYKGGGDKPVVIATIRMGFGHHRLAYSAASWALANGRTTIFHDLIAIDSPEAGLLKNTDTYYSKFSRWASEIGGVVEKFWGQLMMQGDADSLRAAKNTAAHLQPLLSTFPKDTLLITTHQLVALTAACAGFTNVVNLVVDNWPQWFLTVPKTLNIVQGPVNYQCFLKMGIKSEYIKTAGHWIGADLVKNITTDCEARIQRCQARKPIRILIPVGGAGAQKKFILNFLKALADRVKDGSVQLFLNAGDHKHMKQAFLMILDQYGIEFETIDTTAKVRDFAQRNAPHKPVTLFAFDDYFPAVATTDILCRVSDLLACKPSELAFYPIPKLHIRRVGDHEAASAKRSSEIGDGTVEARTVEDAMEYLGLMEHLLIPMNEAIVKNNEAEIYHGCRNAVDYVLKNE